MKPVLNTNKELQGYKVYRYVCVDLLALWLDKGRYASAMWRRAGKWRRVEKFAVAIRLENFLRTQQKGPAIPISNNLCETFSRYFKNNTHLRLNV